MTEWLTAAIITIARGMRAVLGVPDYERYVAHVHAAHPDREPLTLEQFVQDRMENRYSKPGTRCC